MTTDSRFNHKTINGIRLDEATENNLVYLLEHLKKELPSGVGANRSDAVRFAINGMADMIRKETP